MFSKTHAIMAAIIATTQLVRAEEFSFQDENAQYSGEYAEGAGRSLRAEIDAVDAQGIFSLFDINQDGNIQPAEITQAYNAMDTNDNDNLKQNELLKTMDGQIRSFCGVGPASEAEVQDEQDEEDEQDKKAKKRRNRDNRRIKNNRNARNRRNRDNDSDEDDQDQDQQSNLGMTYGYEEDFSQDEDDFSDDEGGRRLRENARGGNSRRGTWNNSQARNRNSRNNRSRNSRNQKNKRGGKKNKRSKVSRKSLARKRMAKGLFGVIDANNNSSISLKEMFKPFAAADSNYDMNVSLAEFNNMISKGKKPICKQYIVKAGKQAFKTWYEMGTEDQKGSN